VECGSRDGLEITATTEKADIAQSLALNNLAECSQQAARLLRNLRRGSSDHVSYQLVTLGCAGRPTGTSAVSPLAEDQ
jgi:hypothetical protein